MTIRILILLVSFVILTSACGVKGPPLPPLAPTPQRSEPDPVSSPAPEASPSPSSKKGNHE